MNGYPPLAPGSGAAPGFDECDWDPRHWDEGPGFGEARLLLGDATKPPTSARLVESPNPSNDSTAVPPFTVGMSFPPDWDFEHRAQLLIESALKQLVQEHQAVATAKVDAAVKADRKVRGPDPGLRQPSKEAGFDTQNTTSSWLEGGIGDVSTRWADICQRMTIKHNYEDYDFLHKMRGCLKTHVKMGDLVIEAGKSMNLDELVNKTGAHTRTAEAGQAHYLSRFVVRPMGARRLCWDILGAFTILYEIVVFPLQVFSLPSSFFMELMSYMTSVFWTFDLFSQFFMGFTDSAGFMEMRFEKTFRNYFFSWFIFDFSVVGLDWGMMVIARIAGGDSADVAGLMRFRRVARLIPVLRAFRLIRVKKYMAVLRHLAMHIGNEWMLLIMKMMKLLFSLVMMNHYICCGWYMIGTQFMGVENSPEGETWVDRYFDESHLFAWRYLTALQWSLAQFTPSATEIRPMNTWERLYALGVVLFGMAVSASFVSNITNTITQLRQYNASQLQQEHNLRQFLRSHEVSFDLTTRIWHFIRSRTNAGVNMRFPEAEAKLLQELPMRLLVEARAEVFVPKLSMHNMFKNLADMNMTTMYAISHQAMRHQIVVASFEMFTMGQVCPEMIFMINGRGKYTFGQLPRLDEDLSVPKPSMQGVALKGLKTMLQGKSGLQAPPEELENLDTILQDNRWACEACLWMPWVYKGSMIAIANSDLFFLDAAKFTMLVAHLGSIKLSQELFLKDYRRNMDLGIEIHDLNSDMDTLEARADHAFPNAKGDATSLGMSKLYDRSRSSLGMP